MTEVELLYLEDLRLGQRFASNQKLDALALPPTVRADVERQRPKLAGIETSNLAAHLAIQESFVSAYRVISWLAAGLAIASSLSAAILISNEAGTSARSQPFRSNS